MESSSESSDEDYVPNKNVDDSSGSELAEDCEDDFLSTDLNTRKRSKKTLKSGVKHKQTKTNNSTAQEDPIQKELSEQEKKRKEEDVWADFMKDTGFQTKKNNSISATKTPAADTREKVKVTEVFNFAGEEVTVVKEVPKDSLNTSNKFLTSKSTRHKHDGPISGVSGILNKLGKKSKLSTLEKSKLDWDQFKKEENLEDELQSHNKGKDGYLDKQDFLTRADLRRFEIEKKIRTVERSKRGSNL